MSVLHDGTTGSSLIRSLDILPIGKIQDHPKTGTGKASGTQCVSSGAGLVMQVFRGGLQKGGTGYASVLRRIAFKKAAS